MTQSSNTQKVSSFPEVFDRAKKGDEFAVAHVLTVVERRAKVLGLAELAREPENSVVGRLGQVLGLVVATVFIVAVVLVGYAVLSRLAVWAF